MGAANTAQQDFWFRNDDGSESAATFMGSQGDNQTLSTGTANKFRLRIIIEETAGGNANVPWPLYASYNSGTYFQVTTTSNYVRAVTSDNDGWTITDEDLTTAQLTYSGTFDSGRYDDDGVAENNITLVSEYTEREFCLYIVDADVSNNDTIDFRVYETTTPTPCDAYNATPRATVSKGVEDRNVTTSDSVNVNESADPAMLALAVLKSETVNLNESLGRLLESYVSESDSIGLSENVILDAIQIALSADETIDVSDTPLLAALQLILSVDDTLGIAENVIVAALQLLPDVSDAVNVSDTPLLAMLQLLSVVSDTINVTDTPNASVQGEAGPDINIDVKYNDTDGWVQGIKIIG